MPMDELAYGCCTLFDYMAENANYFGTLKMDVVLGCITPGVDPLKLLKKYSSKFHFNAI